MPSYKDTIRWLYAMPPHVIKPGLKRIKNILALLSNPHAAYSSILVGGTNGKGSTCAMLESILTKAGFKTGLYTSPHLERFNERIKAGGVEISDRDVARIADSLKKSAAGKLKPSFFEFTTAMAFEYFREKSVDIAIIEVGMGGRWDATNVLNPIVSIITTVGLDHTQWLGKTLKRIAFEKAGIVKEGGRVISSVEDGDSLRVIKDVARKRHAEFYLFGRDFSVLIPPYPPFSKGGRKGGFDYHGEKIMRGLKLNLKGTHQFKNAACALKAIEVLIENGYKVNAQAIKDGLKNVSWPGRFEIVRKNPFVILDCAHNLEGARALKDALIQFKKSCRVGIAHHLKGGFKKPRLKIFPSPPTHASHGFPWGEGRVRGVSCLASGQRISNLIFILGIMADKDIEGMMRELLPMAHTVIFTEPRTKRRATAAALFEKAKAYSCRVLIRKRVGNALALALKEARYCDTICVAGSIFTIGEARRFLRGMDEIPLNKGAGNPCEKHGSGGCNKSPL